MYSFAVNFRIILEKFVDITPEIRTVRLLIKVTNSNFNKWHILLCTLWFCTVCCRTNRIIKTTIAWKLNNVSLIRTWVIFDTINFAVLFHIRITSKLKSVRNRYEIITQCAKHNWNCNLYLTSFGLSFKVAISY